MALTDDEVVFSADWWLLRLGRQLRDRQPSLDLWWRYYSGDHPLPRGPKRATLAYLDFIKKSRTNLMETVVNSSVRRMQAIGIADEKGKADAGAWRWWQLNKMDARQVQLYRTALSLSVAYTMVGSHPRDPRRPLITAEHPRECIVESDPATRERLAGLKAWYDPILRAGRANVLLGDHVAKYMTAPRGPGPLAWGRTSWTMYAEQPHTLGAVPMVPLECRPDLGEAPLPEFGRVIDVQDRINLGMLNRMTAERYSAFRQKYVTGHKFEKRTDPVTGLQIVMSNPFIPDPGAVWASEGEKTQFGEFSQTDLMGYLKGHEADIRDLLVMSETPAYYYADLINIAADTVAALDVNHIAKVREHHTIFGEDLEETLSLASGVAGEQRDFTMAEIRWRDPRQLNPAVVADAAVKKRSIGYPLEILAEDMGESPTRVERILQASAADNLQAAQMAALLNPQPAPAPAGAPPAPAGAPPAGG